MSLPWFSFNTDDYIGNTMHLTTEEHGAYLLLMLAYYRTGKPLPGYDRALASITKLPLDRWLIDKVAIEPLFVIEDGLWKHDRIEAELLEACSKHAKAVAKAVLAAEARYGKKPPKDAPSIPQAAPKPARSRKTAPSEPVACSEHAPSMPALCSSPPHLQLHTTLSSSSSSRENDDATKAVDEFKKDPAQVDCIPNAINPLGTLLPEDWIPGSMEIETAKAYGMSDDDVKSELLIFHALNAQNGTWSKNWGATWQLFCARWKERKATQAKKPAARLELNTTYAPSPSEWDYGARMWAKDQSKWPRSLGADPSTGRCRCPPEILKKYGINQTVEEPT